jgi:DNA-binding beta-propeller fold protein YncE
MTLRNTRLSAVAMAICSMSGIGRAAEQTPRYTVHRTDSDMQIDGKLEELAWRNAAKFDDFEFPWWKSGKREQTVAHMLWDDQFLYIAYRCSDAWVSGVQTGHDSPVYQDDCVEVFTAPNPKRPQDYFNIEMNVNGAILDQHHPNGPGKVKGPNWNAQGILIATTVNGTLNDDGDQDRNWNLEVAIPFMNFAPVTGQKRPRDGDVWHLNLNRLGGKTNVQHSQWSPGTTPKPAFHTPDTFGQVTFSGLTTGEQALTLASNQFEPVPGFLKLPDDITLGACSAVAVNSREELYVFHRGAQPILCFNADGRFLRSWGDGLIGSAHGLRIASNDDIWVTDIEHHLVFKFNEAGKLLLALGTSDRPGAGREQFNKPTDVAFGPNGEVFVSDGYGNSRVVKFDRHGKFLSTWGTAGDQTGEFDLPHSIVVDAERQVLVGDRENNRIQVFDLNGRHLETWSGFAPYGIAIDSSQRVFIADGRAHQILRLNSKGQIVARQGTQGPGAGQFILPHMLAVDGGGNLYVAEVGGRRVQKFRPTK